MPTTDEAELQPLLVTTLGRTGSTWVTQLLGGHPSILTYPPFKHEVRVLSYWVDVLLALAEPASYLQSVQAFASLPDWWLGRERIYDEETSDDDLLRWLGREHVEHLTQFCKGRVSDFYARLAATHPNKQPRYFAEKTLPGLGNHLTAVTGLYSGQRELFLVRDFRDMLCSILAYNEKQRYEYFNRNLAASDEEYVRTYLSSDVRLLLEGWRSRSDHAHLIRYEDLVLSPYETLDGVLRYLDLESSDAVISRMLNPELIDVEVRNAAEHRTTSNAARSVERWRDDLPADLVAVCNEVFAEAFEEFGYVGMRTAGEQACM